MVENISYKDSFKILFTDKKFLGLSFAFATVNGNFNIYGSLMDDILDPYGYAPDQVSWLGVALMVTGIISAALIGLYVEKTLKYRRIFWVCSLLGILTTIGFPLSLKYYSDQYWIFLILVIMQGMVFIPLQPLCIDYGCDVLFPIG